MVKRETINLDDLENNKSKAAKITVIKRNGSTEPYDVEKMRQIVNYATDNQQFFTDDLLSDTEIKLYDQIKITDVFDEVIKTAANKISMMYPQYEYIAAKLYLIKISKETWGDGKSYPHLSQVLKKGLQHHIYKKEVVDSFSDEEIEKLNNSIDISKDFLFTFKSLTTFFDKYCLNYSKTKKLELPQLSYMRAAMFLHWKDKEDRIENIITTYNNLSSHNYTLATPIMLNSNTQNSQLSSCVLNKIPDDTIGIMDTIKNLGVYSKFKGGTALDVSDLRSKGSYILGNQGNSSGPVPFIKIVEATMKSFNQGGKRPGSCAIYFQWWHYDVEDMIVLKSNGGTDENRARGLKYALKTNNLFIERIKKDENISLFDPKDVPELRHLYGEAFEEKYVEYENRSSIRKKTISARKLWFKIMKERTETGNVYIFHEENVNTHNMVGRYINSSNLCVAGDTKISIKYDNIKTDIDIEQLDHYMDQYQEVLVKSKNIDTGEDCYEKITDFAMTNASSKVMKITDEETGKSITCTPDHKVYTKNRGYVMAKDLTVDDELQIDNG